MDNEVRQAKLEEKPVMNQAGNPSESACPDCYGLRWEIEEEGMLRFRCRVGHAYSVDVLKVTISESTENALWAAMRTLEETTSILRRWAPRSGDRLGPKYVREAEEHERHVQAIRRLLHEDSQRLEQKRLHDPD